MIDTTLGAVAVAEEALARLRLRPLEPVVAYRVAVLIGHVRDRLVHYHAIHGELVKEFGAEREAATPQERTRFGPTVFEVRPDRLEAFRARVQTLHAEPISIDVSLLDIASLGSEPMTAADMDVLLPLLSPNGHGGSHG